jgi:hypothetical protein
VAGGPAQLNGSAPGDVSTTWTVAVAPDGATATFDDAASVNATATCSMAGDYILRLNGAKNGQSNFDTVSLTVAPAPNTRVANWRDC